MQNPSRVNRNPTPPNIKVKAVCPPLTEYDSFEEFASRHVITPDELPRWHTSRIQVENILRTKLGKYQGICSMLPIHRVYLIVNQTYNVALAFAGLQRVRHDDGEYYWSEIKFKTLMCTYKLGVLHEIYLCENKYILATLDHVKKPRAILAQHDERATGKFDISTLLNCTELHPIDSFLTDANRTFFNKYCLDPSKPIDEEYERWTWGGWQRFMYRRRPELDPKKNKQIQDNDQTSTHIIIQAPPLYIRAKLLGQKKNADGTYTTRHGEVNRIYKITMKGSEVTNVERCHGATLTFKVGPELLPLDLTHHTVHGNTAQVYKQGRSANFDVFMIKHVVDTDNFDNRNWMDWDSQSLLESVRCRRVLIQIKYDQSHPYTMFAANEKEIREAFLSTDGNQCIVEAVWTPMTGKKVDYTWSNRTFPTIQLVPDKNPSNSPKIKICPKLYALVKLEPETQLPTHLQVAGPDRSYDKCRIETFIDTPACGPLKDSSNAGPPGSSPPEPSSGPAPEPSSSPAPRSSSGTAQKPSGDPTPKKPRQTLHQALLQSMDQSSDSARYQPYPQVNRFSSRPAGTPGPPQSQPLNPVLNPALGVSQNQPRNHFQPGASLQHPAGSSAQYSPVRPQNQQRHAQQYQQPDAQPTQQGFRTGNQQGYAQQNQQGFGPGNQQGYAQQNQQGFRPGNQQGYAQQNQQGFGPGNQQVIRTGNQQGYAQQNQQGFGPGNQQAYAQQTQQGYGQQNQRGSGPQTQQGYGQQNQRGFGPRNQRGFGPKNQRGFGQGPQS